jgi:fructose-1,6-bisphosphatase/sedoheptulose 1,7-bisphosphatase-like protein
MKAAHATETQVLTLHSITSQKIVIFIATAIRASSFMFKIVFENKGVQMPVVILPR